MIKKKVFSKKGNLVTDNPVALILIILIIASVFMFLYKADINKYLRNLPGYSVSEEDVVIDFTNAEHKETLNFCLINVGQIREGKEIFFCENLGSNCGKEISSKLEWVGSNSNAEIKVREKFFGIDWLNPDDIIGKVNSGIVSISPEIIDKGGGDLPNYELLLNLNGAYYLEGNKICREEKVERKEQGDECVKNAYFASEDYEWVEIEGVRTRVRLFNKIEKEVNPEENTVLLVEINNRKECEHKILINKNKGKPEEINLVEGNLDNANFLIKVKKNEEFYYKSLRIRDAIVIVKGIYSFEIKNSKRETIFEGYEIKVEN